MKEKKEKKKERKQKRKKKNKQINLFFEFRTIRSKIHLCGYTDMEKSSSALTS